MSIHEIPGGQVELRDELTVAGREMLQEEIFGLTSHIQRQIERVAREGGTLKTRSGKDLKLEMLSDLNEIPTELMDREFIKASHALQRAAVVAYVERWTLPFPPPTLGTVGNLNTALYDALGKLVTPLVARAMVGDDFGPDALASGDPKAQPGASPASSASAPASPLPNIPATETPSLSTRSTDTAESSDSPTTSTWQSQPPL